MPNITKQQAINRWDKLPMILREAIFSERNADILWSVCGDQHLPDDKIRNIASLTGDVLMGFTYPDDLAKEIKEALALNPIIIDSIIKEVNNKIFAPIRSEINKALALPILTEEEIEAEEAAEKAKEIKGPIVSDITKEIRYTKPEGIEAEPIKIIGAEKGEKVVILTGELNLPADGASKIIQEGPVIIQKEEEFKPVMGSKKSLGELFGFLGALPFGKEVKKEAPVAAKIEIGGNNNKLKEILELKPEANFPLDLLHIKSPLMTNDLRPTIDDKKEKPILITIEDKKILLPQGAAETPMIIKSIENKEEILKSSVKEKPSEEKEKIKVVHYSDLKTLIQPISDIKAEIKPEIKLEAKPEAKPFEIKIGTFQIESSKIEPIKEIPKEKEKVKIVDFTAEAIIPKKTEIIQDIAPKAEIIIGNINIPKPSIIEKKQDKIEQSFIELENQKNNQEEPRKKKGFFGFLFRKKITADNQISQPSEVINEKFAVEKENKQAADINADEQVIKLIKNQIEAKK
ncbi:MAG: hypothetical protein AAB396_01920 [Patescibacteria group bacterium]